MTDRPDLTAVVGRFFASTDPLVVSHMLQHMAEDVSLGRLALLPRSELARRALLAQQLAAETQGLYDALVATWGDDPTAWDFPVAVREACFGLLALHLAQAADHTLSGAVAPTGAQSKRARRRGRAGV